MCIVRISLLLTLLPTPEVQLANYRDKPQHILIHSTPLHTIPQITSQSSLLPRVTLSKLQRSPCFATATAVSANVSKLPALPISLAIL
ncbi:hypothetical protein F4781DRAFT_402663, partial [Annulohypoxylon bovei var. microspora]